MTLLHGAGRIGTATLLALLLGLALPAARQAAGAQGENGLVGENAYESPSFGYEVEWSEDWSADPERVTTGDAGDQLLLDNENGFIFIVGVAIEVAPVQAIEAALDGRDPAPEIVDSDESDDLAWTQLSYELDDTPLTEYIEARPIDGGVLIISLTAPDDDYAEVALLALDGVTIDGDPLFLSLSDDEGAAGGASATSEVWGVSIAWDEEVWTFDEDASFVDEEAQQDLLVLRSDAASLYLDAKAAYDGDPEECLEAEAELLENESGIVEFGLAEGEDGPLTGTTEDGVVYGFYLSTLEVEDDPETEDDEAGEFELASYIECRTLVEGEAVVAVTLITQPDDFDEQFDLATEVIDSIELPEAD
jgi:hypothetical protein